MKVWLLDNGSIVIEHTQLLWNVPGPQARIPVYSVLVEHDEGLFLFDTGFSPEPRKMVDRYQPVEMRPIEEALRVPGSRARNERGALAVSKFKSLCGGIPCWKKSPTPQ